MFNVLEGIYSPRNKAETHKEIDHGAFPSERGKLFSAWIGAGKRVTDLGCCNGSLTRYYIKGNTVTGIDVDSKAPAACPREIMTEQWDLNAAWHEQKGGQYDIVVASEVIEHPYNPEQVFKKIAFVLVPEGVFMGPVPNAFNLKNRIRLLFANKKATPLGEPTHINHFSCRELHNLLVAQFDEVEIVPMVQKNGTGLQNCFQVSVLSS